MFTNKTKKSNSLASNTQQKFKSQLMSNGIRSFESASGLLRKTGSQLKQTKLSLCQKDNKLIFSGFVEEPIKKKSKQYFDYVPVTNVLKKSCCSAKEYTGATTVPMKKVEPLSALPTAEMSKPGRDLRYLMGRVHFCIKMHKMQPQLNAIWDVYGKLLRIIVGKRGEHTLLLRTDNTGPILQAIYYDYGDELKFLTIDCNVHVVGRFIGENRLKTFTVSQVSNKDWPQSFTHIENVITETFMQNHFK